MFDSVKQEFHRRYRQFEQFCTDLYHFLEINETTGMLTLGILVGIACGFAAVGFRQLIAFVQHTVFGHSEGPAFLNTLHALPWYVRLTAPAAGGLLVGPIVHHLSREVRGTGIPEVLSSVVTREGRMRWRVIPLKALASSLTIGTGGSAGREGPIAQIGAGLGSAVGEFLNLTRTKVRTLLGCGAAAGIAGTFNAPLGGVIFSLEILLEDFHVSEFTSIVVSAVFSTAVAQHYLGTTPAFTLPAFSAEAWELLPFALLGLLCGGLAFVFSRTLLGVDRGIQDSLPLPAYWTPALGGLLVGGVGIWHPEVFGVGYHVVDSVLHHELALASLLLLLVAKTLCTILTVGSGGSGGIFAPSLFLGATTGGSFGKVLNVFTTTVSVNPSSYALVGMGAFVAGIAHAPLTAIVLLFEMSRNYRVVLPLMFACVISMIIHRALSGHNVYARKLLRRGLDIREGKETNVLAKLPVRSAMKGDVDYVREDDTLEDLRKVFAESHHTHFPVLGRDSDRVVGTINYTSHWDVVSNRDVSPLIVCRDLARTPPVTVTEEDNLLTALEKISDFHVEVLPVVDDQDELSGVLSRNDIINAYNRELREIRRQ